MTIFRDNIRCCSGILSKFQTIHDIFFCQFNLTFIIYEDIETDEIFYDETID